MTSRESNDDTAFDSCFCLQIYKLFSIRLHFQYKKLESSLKTMAADPFPDRLPQSREWVSNQELKGMQEYSIVLRISPLALAVLWLMISLNSLVFIFSTLLVHLDFKNILYLYGVNNTKVSKIWQSCKIKQKTTPN